MVDLQIDVAPLDGCRRGLEAGRRTGALGGYSVRQTEWMELYAKELALCPLELKEVGR